MAAPVTEVPEHLESVLNSLKELQRRLDAEMNSGLAASKGAGINPAHVRMGMQLTNASTQISRECRAWAKQLKALASTASLDERCAAVVKFLQELPEEMRAGLLEEFRDE